MPAKQQVKSDEARKHFRELLSSVERGEFVEIQRYSTPTAVMVPVDWFERAAALMETDTDTE